MAILIFNMSFAADMKHLYLCEVRVPCDSDDSDGSNCHLPDQSAKKHENNRQ